MRWKDGICGENWNTRWENIIRVQSQHTASKVWFKRGNRWQSTHKIYVEQSWERIIVPAVRRQGHGQIRKQTGDWEKHVMGLFNSFVSVSTCQVRHLWLRSEYYSSQCIQFWVRRFAIKSSFYDSTMSKLHKVPSFSDTTDTFVAV